MSKTIDVPYIPKIFKKQRFSHIPHAFVTKVGTFGCSPLVAERWRSRLRYSAPKQLHSAVVRTCKTRATKASAPPPFVSEGWKWLMRLVNSFGVLRSCTLCFCFVALPKV
ncbi:unnamed protein product [Ixodes pacificus]